MDTAKRYVNTVDTAPTVLWALGLEPLPNCRGQVPWEAFTAERPGESGSALPGESGSSLLGMIIALIVGCGFGWVARMKSGPKQSDAADVSEKEMLVGE